MMPRVRCQRRMGRKIATGLAGKIPLESAERQSCGLQTNCLFVVCKRSDTAGKARRQFVPMGQVVEKQLYGGKPSGARASHGGQTTKYRVVYCQGAWQDYGRRKAAFGRQSTKFRMTGCQHGGLAEPLPAHGNGGSQRPAKNTTQHRPWSLLRCVSASQEPGWESSPPSVIHTTNTDTAWRATAGPPQTHLEAPGCKRGRQCGGRRRVCENLEPT